jgi:uncharacterized protein (TIGR00303 family)
VARSDQRCPVDVYNCTYMRTVERSNRLAGEASLSFVHFANDPDATLAHTFSSLRGRRGKFFLCLGATQTSEIEGVSAAGVSPEARRLTPCIDAEALLAGRALTAGSLPVSPAGIVSPIVITRACLALMDMEIEVVDCGTFAPPMVVHTKVGNRPASCVSSGEALGLEEVEALFRQGQICAAQAASQFDYVVLAECVPGGTTTALGVLSALGWNVRGMLSGSSPTNDHSLKEKLVAHGLERAGWKNAAKGEALSAVAAVGDPMQPFVAGMAVEASKRVPVFFAGGSQMLAIFALYRALLDGEPDEPSPRFLPTVVTTKWVAFDPGADTIELSKQILAPYAVACPDFTKSRHSGLRAYEDGNVKEGTGAGAAMALAHAIAGVDEEQILFAIDSCYDELIPHASNFER